MKKEKLTSIMIVALLLLSTLAFIPIRQVNSSSGPIIYWVEADYKAPYAHAGTEDDPYGNITYALSIAGPDNIIKVKPGIYNSTIETFPLKIQNKANITLMSTDGPDETIIQLGSGVGIEITTGADGFVLGGSEGHGFKILSAETGTTFAVQIVNNPNNVEISYNVINTTGSASMAINIGAGGATNLTIKYNEFITEEGDNAIVGGTAAGPIVNPTVSDNTFTSTPGSTSGIAVQFTDTENATITGNTINNYGTGICLHGEYGSVTNVTISDNTISGCKKGIAIGHSSTTDTISNVTMELNTISSNGKGLWIDSDSGIRVGTLTVENNTFSNNAEYGLENTHTDEINATLNWWGDDTGPSEIGSGYGDAVSTNVLYAPWLGMYEKSIEPTLVKGGYTGLFSVTVKNTGSVPPIENITITYPADFTYNARYTISNPYWYLDHHDSTARTLYFKASPAHELTLGEEITFSINMTGASSSEVYDWVVRCKNTKGEDGFLPPALEVTVDADAPIVSITSLTDDERVGGNVWINATITEAHLEEWVLTINGTVVETGSGNVTYLWDTTAYVDGLYVINVTATDLVGDVGSANVNVTVDNSAPQLLWIKLRDQNGKLYEPVDGTFWVPSTVTEIQISASFYDTCAEGDLEGYVYFNVTGELFTNNTWIPDTPYDVSDVNSIPVKINITDDQGNRFVDTWQVRKDFNPPTAPTYTSAEPICGGLIIKGINSTDAESGITQYNVYINGTVEIITPENLASSTKWSSGNLTAFSGVLVLNLTAYAGGVVNVTITASDGSGMESNATAVYIETIPEGTWYPIELYEGWNLISPPLIPNSTDLETVLELMLKAQSFTDVVDSVYYYDASTEPPEWKAYIPGVINEIGSIEAGKGYFIKMKASDVLIIHGRELPEPPATPPVYTLYQGWNLIGFKETAEMDVSTYFTTVPTEILNSAVIFGWDSLNQEYYTVWVGGTPLSKLKPGEGYWIYVIEQCYVAPP